MLAVKSPEVYQISPPQIDLGILNRIQFWINFSFVSYGVHVDFRASDRSLLIPLTSYLPPGWQPSVSPEDADLCYFLVNTVLEEGGDLVYQLYRGVEQISQTQNLEDVYEIFDSDLRLQVGIQVEDYLFVHAGVVGWQGKAIAIPGRSFSGKTTLVAELVRAGATYYSDEYAVLDQQGLVHPYPRQLSIRQGVGKRNMRCDAAELGGKVGTEPLPITMVVSTHYVPDAVWEPRQISGGQAILAMFDNTIVAQLRPEFALSVLSQAISGAVGLEGDRGETQQVAVALLERLESC
jgi:hypothetical protein